MVEYPWTFNVKTGNCIQQFELEPTNYGEFGINYLHSFFFSIYSGGHL